MSTGDKVICVGTHSSWRGRFKPPIRAGWLYVVEQTKTVEDSNGTHHSLIKLQGIEPVPTPEGNFCWPETGDFVEITAAKDLNKIRRGSKL